MTDWERAVAVREAFDEFQRVIAGLLNGADHVLLLNNYEAVNLRALLDAIQTQYPGEDNPLRVLDTGDWTYQVRMRLPMVDGTHAPNTSSNEQIRNVRSAARRLPDERL